MPQPLSRVNPKAGVTLANAGDYPTDRHPSLALRATKVIAAWATLESFLNNLFVTMLGAHSKPATAIYTALTSTAAQDAALLAAARVSLHSHENELFETIRKLIAPLQKERNKIAHWIWGDSAQIPDAVLLCDPDMMARSLAEEPGQFPELPKDKIFVYRSPDFDRIIFGIERVNLHVHKFRFLVDRGDQQRGNPSDPAFLALCDEPDIRQELLRHRARQKKAPTAPA